MKKEIRIALLVVSDRASTAERADGCEELLRRWLQQRGHTLAAVKIVPDGSEPVAAVLRRWADDETYELIVTAGGTGLSARDQTPEATLAVATRLIPGIGEAMRVASHKITPNAILSRAVAVQRGESIIINLPGSPKAMVENLSVVFEGLVHGIGTMVGDQTDCAPSS